MARWMVAIDSRSSRSSGVPYDALMPMQPRPISETSRPCRPSFRFLRLIPLLLSRLLAKPLESVCKLRPLGPFVGELADQQRERLGVAGDPQGTGVHRIKTYIADQLDGNAFAARIISAVDEAGPGGLAPGLENAEEHLARHRIESADDPRFRNPFRKLLRARGREAEDEPGILIVHRERAGQDHLSRQITGLSEDVVQAGPVHGQQESVRLS